MVDVSRHSKLILFLTRGRTGHATIAENKCWPAGLRPRFSKTERRHTKTDERQPRQRGNTHMLLEESFFRSFFYRSCGGEGEDCAPRSSNHDDEHECDVTQNGKTYAVDQAGVLSIQIALRNRQGRPDSLDICTPSSKHACVNASHSKIWTATSDLVIKILACLILRRIRRAKDMLARRAVGIGKVAGDITNTSRRQT